MKHQLDYSRKGAKHVLSEAEGLAKEASKARITMKCTMIKRIMLAAFLFLLACAQAYAQTDSLPSWNDGAAKKAITDFVKRVTAKGGKDFVPPAERIAVFDDDDQQVTHCSVEGQIGGFWFQGRATTENADVRGSNDGFFATTPTPQYFAIYVRVA